MGAADEPVAASRRSPRTTIRGPGSLHHPARRDRRRRGPVPQRSDRLQHAADLRDHQPRDAGAWADHDDPRIRSVGGWYVRHGGLCRRAHRHAASLARTLPRIGDWFDRRHRAGIHYCAAAPVVRRRDPRWPAGVRRHRLRPDREPFTALR